MLFVLDEVLLEHAHELAGGFVERRFVLPGLPAKALGLTTPLSLLGRADEVIELRNLLHLLTTAFGTKLPIAALRHHGRY